MRPTALPLRSFLVNEGLLVLRGELRAPSVPRGWRVQPVAGSGAALDCLDLIHKHTRGECSSGPSPFRRLRRGQMPRPHHGVHH